MKRLGRPSGFTLVEILIAMVILSFLSLFTAEAIQRALKTKAKVQGDIDKSSAVRDALRIMERDINMAFNYHDPYVDLYNQAQDERLARAKKGTNNPNNAPVRDANGNLTNNNTPALGQSIPNAQGQGPINPDDYKHKEVKVSTQFIGAEDSLSLTTLSNVRMLEESPISQQAEVGYRLKPCRRRSTQEASSNCLWRRVSNYIHDDITKEGQETVLLENVKEFKLRYLGPGKEEEWVNQWATDEHGDGVTKGKFPYAVEVTLAVQDEKAKTKDKELRMTMVASVRNPNNPKVDPKTGQATDPNAQQNQPNPAPNAQ